MHSIAFVTGAYGFIGRHLAKQLSQKGYQVAGIGHGDWTAEEAQEWGISTWLESDVEAASLDIAKEMCGEPHEIYHIAGGSSVGRAILDPLKDFDRTANSTAVLMNWARINTPLAKIVLSSSAAVYGAGHESPIQETDTLNPFSPYGYHKRIAELILKSYSESFGMNTAIVRLFSVYGAGLKKQILWDTLNKLNKSPQQLELFGTGQEQRDFLHIQDAVELLILAGSKASEENLILNGGTGTGVTIEHLARELCKAYGCNIPIHFNGKNRAGDPLYLVSEMSFAHSFGFIPSRTIKFGIQDYVSWFQYEIEKNKQFD